VVSKFTYKSEADQVSVLISFLLGFGTACGAGPYVLVGAKRHYARFYAVLVGATGRARKGTSWAPTEALFDAVRDHGKRFGLSDWEFDYAFLSSGEGALDLVRDEVKDQKGEITTEGCETKSHLIVDEEFAATLKAAKREGNTVSAVLRRLFDSGKCRSITKNSKLVTTNAHLSLLGHITNRELGLTLSESDVSNGLANRFLWCAVRRQQPQAIPLRISDEIIEPLASKVVTALQVAQDPGEIQRSPEFDADWCKLYPRLTEDKYMGRLGDIVGRAEAQVIRLALAYCLLDGKRTMEPEHLESAIALWNYCEESARYLFGEAQDAENDDSIATKIVGLLESGAKTQSEMTNTLGKHGGSELKKALAHLESVGRITRNITGGGKGNGRPLTTWNLSAGTGN
jgi:hypothetical protein